VARLIVLVRICALRVGSVDIYFELLIPPLAVAQ
jgi:hypothetical protein